MDWHLMLFFSVAFVTIVRFEVTSQFSSSDNCSLFDPCLNDGMCGDDEDGYSCVCPSSHTGNTCQLLKTNFEISVTASDKGPINGTNITIVCQGNVEGAFFSVEWETTGTSSNRNFNTIHSGPDAEGIATLVLTEVQAEDSGRYFCKADLIPPISGYKSARVRIEVDVPVFFIYSPTDSEYKVTSDLMLNCVVRGKPIPTILWSKEGMAFNPESESDFTVVNAEPIEIEKIYEVRSSLAIGNLRVDRDSGIYSCVASNTRSTKIINFNVDIVEPETPQTVSLEVKNGTNSQCLVSWKEPKDKNDVIKKYCVYFYSFLIEKDEIIDNAEPSEIGRECVDPSKLDITIGMLPNRNYTAILGALVGNKEYNSTFYEGKCDTPPTVPSIPLEVPKLGKTEDITHSSFTLTITKALEENGYINCYELVVVEADSNFTGFMPDVVFPPEKLSTNNDTNIAYAFGREFFNNLKSKEIVIGSDRSEVSYCPGYAKRKREVQIASEGPIGTGINLPLKSGTNYKTFVRAYVGNKYITSNYSEIVATKYLNPVKEKETNIRSETRFDIVTLIIIISIVSVLLILLFAVPFGVYLQKLSTNTAIKKNSLGFDHEWDESDDEWEEITSF